MAESTLEQYKIADFLDWHKRKKIILNPFFQRREVWTPAAKSYLIDTILRRLPIPKVYLRTIIDLKTKASIREVVDGQQRLRAIFEFASDQLVLGKTAKEFQGLTYSTLDPKDQENLLSYSIAAEQLINASDSDVLEIFARLNSYTVQLNPAELRHATFQGDFKWAVRESSKKWSILWDEFKVVSLRHRLRMMDDALMAEMFGVLLDGITDGGARNIKKLYEKYNSSFPNQEDISRRVDEVLRFITKQFRDILVEPICRAPHFLMLFGAVAHSLSGIPLGQMGDEMPVRRPVAEIDKDAAKENYIKLAGTIESDEPPKEFQRFWQASRGTTHRISSRRVRFPIYYRALFEKL